MGEELSNPENGAGSWWKSKFVLGPLMAALTAIFVSVATPVGDWVRNLLFPTGAVVEGSVVRDDKPVPRLRVVLDGKSSTTTTDSGKFIFAEVAYGVHSIDVYAEGNQLLFHDAVVIIKRGEKERLSPFNLNAVPEAKTTAEPPQPAPNPAFVLEPKQPEYQVALVHTAAFLPPEERMPGFETNTRRITVEVQAPDEALSSIERVTYYLHPTFNPSVVTRDSPADKFALTFTAWGQFELKAKVYFRDGQVKDLSRYLAF